MAASSPSVAVAAAAAAAAAPPAFAYVVFVFVIGITCWSMLLLFFSLFRLIIISQDLAPAEETQAVVARLLARAAHEHTRTSTTPWQ